jgi:glycosyltransferase involved in cell wall biosynthesis
MGAPAAIMVPCDGTSTTIGGVNAIGGVPDETAVVKALESLYHSPGLRHDLSRRGLALVQQPQFRWENIGARFAEEVERAFSQR